MDDKSQIAMLPDAPDDIDGEFLIKTFFHRIDEIANRDEVKATELKAALETYLKLEERSRELDEGQLPPFEPNLFDHQGEFVHSKTRFTALIGGVRSGKTYAGAVKGIERALFLPTIGAAVAPTAAMARDVLVPQYAELLGERVAKWLSSNMEMTLANGSKIIFRSADRPERLMGLTLDWFHLDEAAQLPKRVWEILVNRTISTGGPGFLTTTPRGRNWVFDLVRDWEHDSDAKIIIAKTSDNPQISIADIARGGNSTRNISPSNTKRVSNPAAWLFTTISRRKRTSWTRDGKSIPTGRFISPSIWAGRIPRRSSGRNFPRTANGYSPTNWCSRIFV